jgi:hypothetical protein
MAQPDKNQKPSLFGKEEWIKSSILSQELKKDEYFHKLGGMYQKERIEIGKILGGAFGEYIRKGDWRIQSLIRELKEPGSSSDSKIRETAKAIREKLGEYKSKTLAEVLKEKFGL